MGLVLGWCLVVFFFPFAFFCPAFGLCICMLAEALLDGHFLGVGSFGFSDGSICGWVVGGL
jgi:hypothetical protein